MMASRAGVRVVIVLTIIIITLIIAAVISVIITTAIIIITPVIAAIRCRSALGDVTTRHLRRVGGCLVVGAGLLLAVGRCSLKRA